MLRNLLCLYSEECRFYTILTLGTNVCGHQGIVHGGARRCTGNLCLRRPDRLLHAGLTAALVDETLGSLVYILKREGRLGEGPSFTVRLEMDYRSAAGG